MPAQSGGGEDSKGPTNKSEEKTKVEEDPSQEESDEESDVGECPSLLCCQIKLTFVGNERLSQSGRWLIM